MTSETYNGKLEPVFTTGTPIVISFDNNYAVSGGALINSIVRHADKNKNYDIVVLENKVSNLNKNGCAISLPGRVIFHYVFLMLMYSPKLALFIPARILVHQHMRVCLYLSCSAAMIKLSLLILIQ